MTPQGMRPAQQIDAVPSPAERANALSVSVVLSTYENPHGLSLALAGLERQTRRDFELIVADDGSGEATRRTIERFARKAPFAVFHVWQEDAGFRKCKILNAAIERAGGDYLVFLDG